LNTRQVPVILVDVRDVCTVIYEHVCNLILKHVLSVIHTIGNMNNAMLCYVHV